MKEFIIDVCEICGKKYPRPVTSPNRTTCTRRCTNALVSRRSAQKRGDALRRKPKSTGGSYVKVGGRHEHRIVAEEMLGRPLKKGEIVHHKDGNKQNNSPENLEIMTQSEHAAIHSVKNRLCEIEGCERKHYSKGMCQYHYNKALLERKRRECVGSDTRD